MTVLRMAILVGYCILVAATYPVGPTMLGVLFVISGCAIAVVLAADWVNEARRRDW